MKAEDCFHLKKLICFFFSETKQTKKKKQSHGGVVIRYLVRVAEFTDLPGNQVSLVVLHLHGADVLLARKEKEQKEEPTKHHRHRRQISSNWQSRSVALAYLLLLLFPLLVAGLAVRVLRGSVELTGVLSDQDVNGALDDLVPPQRLLVQNLLLVLLRLRCTTSVLC